MGGNMGTWETWGRPFYLYICIMQLIGTPAECGISRLDSIY